jgi:hypothetical protein
MIDEHDETEPHNLAGSAPRGEPGDGIAAQVGAKRPAASPGTYRATYPGGSEPPPPPPTPSRGPFFVAVAALVAIAVAGSALVALAVVPTGTLPGANNPTVPPPGLATSSPSAASPSPSPTIDPGVAVQARFWALISDKQASYHMNATGKSTLDKKTLASYKESLDIVGDEYSGWIDGSASPKGTIARKDGVVWVKIPGKKRVGRVTSERYFRLTPFLYLDLPGWIDYVKPVAVSGRHLHLLRSNRFYRPDIARMLDFQKFLIVPDKMVLDLYVTDDGVPVSATFTADVNFRDTSGRHAFHGRTSFTFSKFGAKLVIRVPKR